MFDTMTLTKIAGGFCGAFLVFLLGQWAAELIYHGGAGHGDHGDHHAAGYKIEVAAVSAAAVVDEGPTLDELLASADIDKGAKVFGKCKACHKIEDGANSTGPHLYGIVDRATGSVDGFGYSGALVAVTPDWNVGALDGFLANPKKYAPGTKMSFSGLKKPADRANLIVYLDSLDD